MVNILSLVNFQLYNIHMSPTHPSLTEKEGLGNLGFLRAYSKTCGMASSCVYRMCDYHCPKKLQPILFGKLRIGDPRLEQGNVGAVL